MENRIRIGIAGYGNLGRGVELALRQNPDMTLRAVYTRRNPAEVTLSDRSVAVHPLQTALTSRDDIDVMILCGGSKQDLPVQGPTLSALFNTVDSFDTHAHVPEYFDAMDRAARASGKTALISIGWDPGLFSLARLYGEVALPQGKTYTFWGKGLSQGHSDAIRKVPGVRAGVQYTIPIAAAVEQVRSGAMPELSTREKHRRDCYVVLADGADASAVERAIVSMPDYFADYDTRVTFISAAELQRDHAAMPHGGFVIRSGQTGQGTRQTVEYALKLDSNPEFTASVLVAYARAAFRLNRLGRIGAHTALDVPPALLSPKDAATLRRELI